LFMRGKGGDDCFFTDARKEHLEDSLVVRVKTSWKKLSRKKRKEKKGRKRNLKRPGSKSGHANRETKGELYTLKKNPRF